MKFPKVIEVERRGSTAVLKIDGEDFPWAIARGGVSVNPDPDNVPTVTVTLVAERVFVDNQIGIVDDGVRDYVAPGPLPEPTRPDPGEPETHGRRRSS